MRFAILSSLALLPVLAHAQAAAPAGSQTLASLSQPKLVRVSSSTPAAPAAIAVAPVSFHDVIRATLNTDLRDERDAAQLSYSFYGDAPTNDLRVQAPRLVHIVGRALPLAQMEDPAKSTVAVHVIVNGAGVPEFASIVRSAGTQIDNSTLAAVREYRFTPAKVDGIPVEADMTVTIQAQKN